MNMDVGQNSKKPCDEKIQVPIKVINVKSLEFLNNKI